MKIAVLSRHWKSKGPRLPKSVIAAKHKRAGALAKKWLTKRKRT